MRYDKYRYGDKSTERTNKSRVNTHYMYCLGGRVRIVNNCQTSHTLYQHYGPKYYRTWTDIFGESAYMHYAVEIDENINKGKDNTTAMSNIQRISSAHSARTNN